jgi:predicted ester cyclase
MTSDDNKRLTNRAAEELFNNKDLSVIEDLFAVDFVDHSAPEGAPQGPEGQRAKVAAFVSAFPDLHLAYSHQICEGDLVAGRYTLTGTHLGEFAGIAATGNSISLEGHDLLRVRDGRIVEHWTAMDTGELMRQLGVG